MRTNIVIDSKLMEEAKQALGTKTMRETVEVALRRLVQVERQTEIRKYRGKLQWEGDLDAMRTDG